MFWKIKPDFRFKKNRSNKGYFDMLYYRLLVQMFLCEFTRVVVTFKAINFRGYIK